MIINYSDQLVLLINEWDTYPLSERQPRLEMVFSATPEPHLSSKNAILHCIHRMIKQLIWFDLIEHYRLIFCAFHKRNPRYGAVYYQ